MALTGKDVPFVWGPGCSTSFYSLRDSLIHARCWLFLRRPRQYILDTDASNFGLGGVLSQIQDDYSANIRSRATPELFGHHPKPGFSRIIRLTSEVGLFPDYPTDIRSRAIPSLPRLRKAFLRRQKRIYLMI